MSNGTIFVQTNEADRNRVIAFARAADGSLEGMETYETGGAGDGVPHLTSQGSVVLTGDGRHLLVTNAGSGELSVFAVGSDGLRLVETVSSGGEAPKSVAEHAGLVYVVADGAVSRYSLAPDGSITLSTIRSRRRPSRAKPASGTRRSPATASFSMRSMPTQAGSSAGPWATADDSIRSDPGAAFRRRLQASRRADAGDLRAT
jgi:hypothetical protein